MTIHVPDTQEMPRVAAALVVTYERRQLPQVGARTVQVPVATRLEVVRVVDFYRDDLYRDMKT